MEIKFEREALFDEVWAAPISTLAKKYGLSDNGLRKVCLALDVPLPGRGYWAKIAAGHQLPIPPLPPTVSRTFFVCRLPESNLNEIAALGRDAALKERLAFEAAPENVVVVPAELTKPHRLVAAAASAIRSEITNLRRSRDYVRLPRKPGAPWEMSPRFGANWGDYEQRGVMELGEELLPVRVSIEASDRALRIWNALLRACETRGLRVSAAPRQVKISDGPDTIGMRMSEKVDRVTRPTAWGKGEETVSRNPTGRLRLFAVHCGETKFEDSPERPLELQLNAILMWMHRTFASQRAGRVVAAERKRLEEAEAQIRAKESAAAAEAARLREEELRRWQAEQAAIAERERLLAVEASTWRDAEAIRAYIAHVAGSISASGELPGADVRAWLSWAACVADKLDPTSKRSR